MPGQLRVLARAFLDRFFETETTGGAGDLRTSLFWTMAFLAVPGIFLPVMMSFGYHVVAVWDGPEALRIASRGNKAFYLGLSMVASGGLAAIVWNSLLLDRRDGLVLGALPVRGRTIVWAKIAALAGYIGLISVAMHALASVAYGFSLSVRAPTFFAFTGIVAHFVASTAASAFAFLAIVAVQGVLFATLGPRLFDKLSPVFQVLVAAIVLGGFILLPDFDFTGSAPPPWLLWTPPLWFLGVYESILSTRDPMLVDLTRTALTALATVTAVTLVSYPLAYRRLVSTVVETAGRSERARVAIAPWIVRCLSRSPITRASAQFYLASIARNARHRFIVAASVGLAVAIAMPVLVGWLPDRAAPIVMPPIALLALPFQAMVFMLIGLRLAAAIPADLRAAWTVAAAGPSSVKLRAGVWRVMFVFGVAVTTIATAPIYWRWGAVLALQHMLVCLTLGAALTEALLWGFDGMPCGRPWRPEHANVRKWWPAYLLGFAMITISLPAYERLVFREPFGTAWLVGVLATIALALRVSHRRRRVLPEEDLDEPGSVQLLNLN